MHGRQDLVDARDDGLQLLESRQFFITAVL